MRTALASYSDCDFSLWELEDKNGTIFIVEHDRKDEIWSVDKLEFQGEDWIGKQIVTLGTYADVAPIVKSCGFAKLAD